MFFRIGVANELDYQRPPSCVIIHVAIDSSIAREV